MAGVRAVSNEFENQIVGQVEGNDDDLKVSALALPIIEATDRPSGNVIAEIAKLAQGVERIKGAAIKEHAAKAEALLDSVRELDTWIDKLSQANGSFDVPAKMRACLEKHNIEMKEISISGKEIERLKDRMTFKIEELRTASQTIITTKISPLIGQMEAMWASIRKDASMNDELIRKALQLPK